MTIDLKGGGGEGGVGLLQDLRFPVSEHTFNQISLFQK